jgi:hypothetical protein
MEIRNNQQTLEAALYVAQAQSAQNSFSSITDSMGTMFGEQSAMYKAAFVTQKAFAIAQAALQLPMAMGQALAIAFPANIIAMAQVIAQMSTVSSQISRLFQALASPPAVTPAPVVSISQRVLFTKESTSSTRRQRTGSACLSLRRSKWPTA